MTERDCGQSTNLHAPWRAEYMALLGGDADDGCFLCRAAQATAEDEARNLLLWRTPNCLVVMNRYPYTGGHLLVAPQRHVAGLDELSAPVMAELMELCRDAVAVLAATLKAEGFNVGMNLGRCAGAGLPGHLHLHVVPRWPGDTNFFSVLGDVRVIPQSLPELRRQLLAAAERLKLPKILYD